MPIFKKEAKTIQYEKPEAVGEVYRIPIEQLHPHPENPYGIRDDPDMLALTESVRQFGVLCPAIARLRQGGGYELISGHRRKEACQRAGLESMPVMVLKLDDNDAIIQLVDSNIQRETVLPSERAKAYKLRVSEGFQDCQRQRALSIRAKSTNDSPSAAISPVKSPESVTSIKNSLVPKNLEPYVK